MIVLAVLGQMPTGDSSPPNKNKAHLLPTRTTIPRTIPHQDNFKPGSKTTLQEQYVYGGIHGELSWWGVVRIQVLAIPIHNSYSTDTYFF